MRVRGAALVAALVLAGLVPASRAEAQCVDVDGCLDYYTESHEFWTKKDMFTYLVAARAADWKTPEECGMGEEEEDRRRFDLPAR